MSEKKRLVVIDPDSKASPTTGQAQSEVIYG
jgi:hypothetical protein